MMTVLLCVVVCACIYAFRPKSKLKEHELPPAYPGALPFIGHTHMLFTDTSALWLWLQDTAIDAIRQGGVTHVVLGGQIYYMIADAEDALTASNICTHKHFAFNFVKPWLGDGLLTSNGEKWARNRKLLQPTFSLPVIYRFLSIFNSQAKKLVTSVELDVGKKSFSPFDNLKKIALETFCQAIFGIKEVEDNDITENYMTSAATLLSIAVHRFQTFWLHSNMLFNLTGLKTKEQDAANKLKVMTDMIMQKKKTSLKTEDISDDDNISKSTVTDMKYKPALDRLLELSADGTLNDKEIREEVDTMVAAAYETISTQLVYTLLFLGANLEVQNKVFEEILQVLGHDRDVNKEEINQLEYMNAVIMESLRLLPAAPALLRYVEQDVKLKNYTMRAGSQCIIYPLVNPNVSTWGPDGDKFMPERWLKDPELRSKKEFAGFGLGKRYCIGRQYAMVSIKVFLAHFIRQYKVTADMDNLKVKMDFILKPIAGDKITIERRKSTKTSI